MPEKPSFQEHFRHFLPRTVIVLVSCAVVLGLSQTVHAGLFSFLSQTAAVADDSGQSSQTMSILEAPSANPAIPSTATATPPIDGDVLSPDLAAAAQISGIDTPNTQISSYTVQPDDTLSGIADMFDISVATIERANPGIKGIAKGAIQPGDVLTILPVTGVLYTVNSGDTLSGIAKKFNVDVADILTYNAGLSASSALVKGMVLVIPHAAISATQASTFLAHQKVPSYEPLLDPVWEWPTAPAGYYACPVPGARLTQGLHGHNAVDLAIPYGTPIHAAAAGTVIISKSNGLYNGGYGNFVMLSHDNGTETLYAHMSRTAVPVGAAVSQGQVIGYIGMTGLTTGPHVHFEIRGMQNPFVDPALCR